MSQAAAQSAAFFTEAIAGRSVWTVRDEGGYPAPMNGEGRRAQPFWSKESRAKKVVETVPAYGIFDVVEIKLDEFENKWLPSLEEDGLFVGVNWSGKRALGYDLSTSQVLERLKYQRARIATNIVNSAKQHGSP